ncbi:hypothetical protein BO71DRAFT_322170 [Aspergillus ellipticus CBS 707.79]|uniref:Uncharacterized protein n=1 Tax=Aspergillus ellipticus CBS 707.79 TaxID=1448320 RepID=A0A319DEU1_9EURO|nr:hypothetical protein BO71DRAFT_322170 [Aspergillus ellipticus CBS 707.79]
MGAGSLGPPSSFTNNSQQKGTADAKDTYRFDGSDDSQGDSDLTWSPGDGVCPSTAQFNHCYQSKFNQWTNAASTQIQGSESFHYYLQAFLNLLKDVPPFFNSPPEGVVINGKPGSRRRSYLVLKSSLRIQTTEDPDCDQPQKSIDYLQCVGLPAPPIYKTKLETQLQAAIPICAKPLRSRYFSTIVLAWSYIISCRWVEIFQLAGEKGQIFHDQDAQNDNSFWDIITQGCWAAHMKRKKGVFCSPWMLRKEADAKKRGNWISVPPDSFLAFNMLLDFCLSEGFEGEFLTGLASVLMLASRNAPPPKFAPPISIPSTPVRASPAEKGAIFHDLLQSIDRCIFLSSTLDALDSLLCSTFFDPCIPCNLLGAASLGTQKALLETDELYGQRLLSAITNAKPSLSLLWAAVLCCDQATSFMNLALRSLPPICLATAFWTNTTQSFFQIAYISHDLEDSIIPRADEFQTSYFCRPDVPIPWSPAPPFGVTTVANLSLEVKEHLAHIHRPVSWTIYWILSSGERVPASSHQIGPIGPHNVYLSCFEGDVDELPDPERNTADELSGIATSRLFDWHRNYDDGIWLDDGKGDIELVRRLQMHAWIINQFDNQDNESVEEPKQRELPVESILRWRETVEKFRQSGEFA